MQTFLSILTLLFSSRRVLAARCSDVATAGGWEGIASISVNIHFPNLVDVTPLQD